MNDCTHCCPSDAVTAYAAKLEHRQQVFGSSHFDVDLFQCPRCGQHYVMTFEEEVDWNDSDDAQYALRIPIAEDEIPGLAAIRGWNEAHARFRRRGDAVPDLAMDHPTGGSKMVYWCRAAPTKALGDDIQVIRSNLAYMSEQLPTLEFPLGQGERLAWLIEQGNGLLGAIERHGLTASGVSPVKAGEVEAWIQAIHDLQVALRTESERDGGFALPWMLVAESAVNLYPAARRLRDGLPD